jgi:O-antigen ligase
MMKTMSGTIPNPAASGRKAGSRWGDIPAVWGLGLVVFLALLMLALFNALPASFLGWEAIRLLAVGTLFVMVLVVVLGFSRERTAFPKRIGFVLWWFLICSQEIFVRLNTNEATTTGQYGIAAYEEAAFWVLILVALSIAALGNPRFLGDAIRGRYVWLNLYVLLCTASTALSPNPMFSLAWAFKLVLVALVLQLCASQIQDFEDLRDFLRVTLWGLAFLVMVPTIQSFVNPSAAFSEGGRLGGLLAPDEQSAISGILILLLLGLYAGSKKKWPVALGVAGLAALFLSGGKAGIAAAMFCGLLFYGLLGRLRAALGLLTGFVLVGLPLVLFTPLGAYLKGYAQSGDVSTLTGRTPLWTAVLSGISQRPIFGHGFVASEFMSTRLPDLPFAAIHTHNGFLEALYNNGAIGFGLMMLILLYITRNLWRAFRHPAGLEGYKVLAAGLITIFLDLVINALANASFAGRVRVQFILLLGLAVFSETLARLGNEQAAEPDAEQSFPPPLAAIGPPQFSSS